MASAKLKAVDDESLLPLSVQVYNRLRPFERDAIEARVAFNEAKKEIKQRGLNKEAHALCRKYKKRDPMEAAAFKHALDEMWAEFTLPDQLSLDLEPAA